MHISTMQNKLELAINVTANEQDSLTFMAAERMYMGGDKNAAAQFEKYLQQFPNGGFCREQPFLSC